MQETMNRPQGLNILKSSAFGAIVGAVVLVALMANQPVAVESGGNNLFAVGLRMSEYQPQDQLPDWLTPPAGSATPVGHPLSGVEKTRLYFSTGLSARRVEIHYRGLLSANGFQFAVITPHASASTIATIIDAFDAATGRTTQIVIRDVGAARAVEITYRDRIRPKSTSI